MYPYIHLGPLTIGTFGLMLWLAAVCAGYVLHLNFKRFHVNADAVSVVAFVTVLGVVGAKLWHVFEDPVTLFHYPAATLFDRAGFAWYGGLIAGILTLMWQGRTAKVGGLGMLDLAAPAAAVGYGVGRIGCLTSGDGDYGIPTKLPWGMSFPHGLVPTTVPRHPTPIYELIGALIIAFILWHRGTRILRKGQPLYTGTITGEYLGLSGLARFLVEFIRINPPVYFGMSNAQVASLGSMVAGFLLMAWARRRAALRTERAAPAM
jgi:phosphatidylglycerol:prolipoprotein diacylglycerol transferase